MTQTVNTTIGLPQFFTMAELIKAFGGPVEWARDPNVSRHIKIMLEDAGFTQRMIHDGGTVQRTWSRHWGGSKNKSLPRTKAIDAKKLELLERVKRAL